MSSTDERRVKSVLLDTSFLITLHDKTRANHETAARYFQHWIPRKVTLYASTIVVAEYSAKGEISEVILRHLHVLPFNYSHAVRAGQLVAMQLSAKESLTFPKTDDPRDAVKDDIKLFAQTHVTKSTLLATDDQKMPKLVDFFRLQKLVDFSILPLWLPFNHSMASTGERGLF